ncbi:MAG TPA: long-chain fatty acid--CoA ligase [Prevotellaceae bacterium]|nr:long-chain fatty acid--CoA ligase [Prevotellaceae bacterium]HBE54541.1 long-chain fatty acid--CoA ligase [Prevotellaceae bacterium]
MTMIKDYHKTAIIAGERKVSYAEMLRRVTLFARQTPQEAGARTVIFSKNREGWLYAFFSVWLNRGIAVPVDATSTVDELAYMLHDCRPACVWTTRKRLDTLRPAVEKAGISPRILLIEDFEHADDTGMEPADIRYDGPDTALIIYTSGTTGSPKGVMLSFANLFANIRGVSDEVPIFNEHRRTMILLPLHHVLPLQGSMIAPIVRGGGVAICPSLSGKDVMDTLCRGQVSIVIGVPRLWTSIYTGIKKKLDAHLATRMLFSLCAKVGSRSLSRLVFGSVRKKMGGHIDYLVSGGAALDVEVGRGLRTLGLDVLEGYGMTETAPIIAFTRPGDIIPGCVGLPLPSVECKIVDGELCAKGPNVMQGYWGKPEETAKVIDADGYIHTGDLARMDEKGRIYITGRKKETIVLSNGKNVQPDEIEFKLEKNADLVREAAVVQDGDMLRAIIVPQEKWAFGKTEQEQEQTLKKLVLEPYNAASPGYKRVLGLFVYHGDLPRTRMEKLQRFKLKAILEAGRHDCGTRDSQAVEPTYPEYQILKKYIQDEKHVPVHPTDHLETDLAFDSLDKVGLQDFIENTFGMKINADEMGGIANVTALAEMVVDGKTRMEVEQIDWHTLLARSAGHLTLPTASWRYPFHIRLARLFFRLYNRLSITGTENIPAHGPFILAANHQSYLDGLLVLTGLSRSTVSQCYFYAKEDHFRSAMRQRIARRHNVILMERANLKDSILKMAEVLRQGKNVVIFPEGSRTHDGKVGAFKKTFAILSRELGVPVVPVRISGAYAAMPRGHALISPSHISVRYLPAVQPSPGKDYGEQAEEIRSMIANG